MSDYVSVDTMAGAAGYVSREFGDYGYSLRLCRAGFVNALFELRASDGGRRLFLIDRYGNVELAPDDSALDFDIGDRAKVELWTMGAADRLYGKRNGYSPNVVPAV
jgi:hypothetical protein